MLSINDEKIVCTPTIRVKAIIEFFISSNAGRPDSIHLVNIVRYIVIPNIVIINPAILAFSIFTNL